MEVLIGDVWLAFEAEDRPVLLHGVSYNLPAVGGFARTVVDRVGQKAARAHYETPPGHCYEVVQNLLAGVTQRSYGAAEAALIKSVVHVAVAYAETRNTRLVMPLIGAGLGGLSEEESLGAIRRGAEGSPVRVEVYKLP